MCSVAATNIRRGVFADLDQLGQPEAMRAARAQSAAHPGVAFTVFDVRPGNGSYALVTYFNGEQTFTAHA